jgi:hypothetical protein
MGDIGRSGWRLSGWKMQLCDVVLHEFGVKSGSFEEAILKGKVLAKEFWLVPVRRRHVCRKFR